MNRAFSFAGQAVLYGCFAVAIGVFSRMPVYHPLEPGMAQLKVSLLHSGQRLAECRQYSPEELAKLAPNMRKATVCERERSPVTVQVVLDGEQIIDHVAKPAGLSSDGSSTMYRRLNIPAGEHHITVRVKDSQHVEGFNYQREETINLAPAQVMVVDFNAEGGGIVLK